MQGYIQPEHKSVMNTYVETWRSLLLNAVSRLVRRETGNPLPFQLVPSNRITTSLHLAGVGKRIRHIVRANQGYSHYLFRYRSNHELQHEHYDQMLYIFALRAIKIYKNSIFFLAGNVLGENSVWKKTKMPSTLDFYFANCRYKSECQSLQGKQSQLVTIQTNCNHDKIFICAYILSVPLFSGFLWVRLRSSAPLTKEVISYANIGVNNSNSLFQMPKVFTVSEANSGDDAVVTISYIGYAPVRQTMSQLKAKG